MAATTSVVKRTVHGDQRVVYADITFDSTYADDGEAIVGGLASLGLKTVVFAALEQKAPVKDTALVFGFNYSDSAPKVTAFWVDTTTDGAALAEVTASTDVSAYTVRGMFIGS